MPRYRVLVKTKGKGGKRSHYATYTAKTPEAAIKKAKTECKKIGGPKGKSVPFYGWKAVKA